MPQSPFEAASQSPDWIPSLISEKKNVFGLSPQTMHDNQPQSPAAVELASQSPDWSLISVEGQPTSGRPPVSPYHVGTVQDPIVVDESPMSVANK